MAITDRNILKTYFETLDKPNEAEFKALLDSFVSWFDEVDADPLLGGVLASDNKAATQLAIKGYIDSGVTDINDILNNLLPTSPPALEDWTGNIPGSSPAKLSYDSSNPISGHISADLVSNPNPVSVDQLFDVSSKRLGVVDNSTPLTGILNDHVTLGAGNPTSSHPAKAFSNGDLGQLRLLINGLAVDYIDLTSSTAAVDHTTGGTVTGINISSSSPVLFPNGSPFTSATYRMGNYYISPLQFVKGYNSITITHTLPSGVLILVRHDFIWENSPTPTVFTNETLDTLLMTGTRKLSGIDFHTGGTAEYAIDIANLYLSTYYPGADALVINGLITPNQSLAPSLGDENKLTQLASLVLSIPPNSSIPSGLISASTTAKRSVLPTLTSTGVSISGILLDDTPSSSTTTTEAFTDEDYRLPSNYNFNDINPLTGSFDSEQSIKDADAIAGYDNAMQVMGGKLTYPTLDFRTSAIANSSVWNNGGTKGGSRDYSLNASKKKYYRWLKQVAPATGNFSIAINGDAGIQLVDLDAASTVNTMTVSIRLPTQTDWMDCYKDFVAGQWLNGNGCRNLAGGNGGINNVLGLTVGTKSTANSGGIILIELGVADNFAHDVDSINFSFD